MPVFTKGNFTFNLGITCISTEISEEDRQCAWELYCELISRVALMGKEDARGELVFTGELYDQSLDSLYAFFCEARGLMRRYPVGRIKSESAQNHFGFFIAALLEVVIRPSLEQWQASYRHWWCQECEHFPQASPFERQEGYPQLEKMLEDWRVVRRFCRSAAKELTEQFKLPDVTALEPPELKQQWLAETSALVEGRGV